MPRSNLFSLKDKKHFPNNSIKISLFALLVSIISVLVSFKQMMIANQSYLDARKQAIIQSSPYITITKISVDNYRAGYKPSVFISLKNVGMTPAVDLSVYIDSKIAERDQDLHPLTIGTRANKLRFLTPGAETYVRSTEVNALSDLEYSEYLANKTTFKSVVKIVWKDIYQNSHDFQFCLMRPSLENVEESSAVFCD